MDARSKYVSTFDVHAIASRGEGALKGIKKKVKPNKVKSCYSFGRGSPPQGTCDNDG